MNNVIGKILIVLQLVFSLCFMCFAGAVYTFQSGWKARTVLAEGKLANAESNLKAEQEKNRAALEIETAKVATESQKASDAQGQLVALQQSLQQATGNLSRAEQQRDKLQADLVVAQQEADARVRETVESRAEIKRLRDEQNDAIAVRRTLEDEKLDLSGQLALVKEQRDNALAKVAQQRSVLIQNKIDPDTATVGPVQTMVAKVDGVVKQAKKNESRSAELVEISVGSDDGISENQRLIVYRDADYICEIEVTSVFPDSAVGRVLEETRNSSIERGDHVTTKL